jgi:hypothetical protein
MPQGALVGEEEKEDDNEDYADEDEEEEVVERSGLGDGCAGEVAGAGGYVIIGGGDCGGSVGGVVRRIVRVGGHFEFSL